MTANVQDLIRETTATTGAGLTITLDADAEYGRFADVKGGVGTLVYYTIRSGTNTEVGIGTVQATNTFDRTTVLATVVSGVYDDTSPARITLAGTSVVAITPTAAALKDYSIEAPTAIGAGSAGYMESNASSNTTAVTLITDSIALDFFVCKTKAVTAFTKIEYKLTTAGAGTETIVLGIYEISQDLTTATLLESASTTVVTNTSPVDVTLPAYTLEYGKLYALAALTDDATTLRISGSNTIASAQRAFGSVGLSASAGAGGYNEYAITSGWSDLPASINLTTGGAKSLNIWKGLMKP